MNQKYTVWGVGRGSLGSVLFVEVCCLGRFAKCSVLVVLALSLL